MKNIFATKWGIVAVGAIIGAGAALLQFLGNPGNMGICVACFERDIAGGLGLHRAGVVQYIRPEIIGFVLGSLAAALIFKEFRPRGGSAPIVRFVLGVFAMIGALVFLGCPVRMILRLAGGDLNGIPAIAGVLAGVGVGVFFLKRGFSLGRARRLPAIAGWIMPVAMVGLLLLAIFKPSFIFTSESGPGSMFVPIIVGLVIGLVVGFLAQKTRMCFVGGWRDLVMVRDSYLFSAIAAFFVAAIVVNYAAGMFASGTYHWGFADQPVAHTKHLWNFLGMALVGLGCTLLGGCPLRTTILSGEGDSDASITFLGLVAGAAVAHNFLLASSPSGTGQWGPVAVIIGLVVCLVLGFTMREQI